MYSNLYFAIVVCVVVCFLSVQRLVGTLMLLSDPDFPFVRRADG